LTGLGSRLGAAEDEPGAAEDEPGAAEDEPDGAGEEPGAAGTDATETESLAACICFSLRRRYAIG